MTTSPTIADVWAAFLALSAAWDAKYKVNELSITFWGDTSGGIWDEYIGSLPVAEWDTLADAVVKINAARVGMGAG